MQLIPTGLLALLVHLALALAQPVRSPAEPSPELCMRETNKESGICMPNAAAPMMEMAHERKWIFRNSHQQPSNDAAIEQVEPSIQPILPPSPTAISTVTSTPVPIMTSTCTGSTSTRSPSPSPTDYGDYSDYGNYGDYGSYGEYDDEVVS